MKTYSGLITSLPVNGIFTFGSNEQGRHGKGTALIAKDKFGANQGQARGLQGNSYAIVTKDLRKPTHPSKSMREIEQEIAQLYDFAIKHPELEFFVAYTAGGDNLNGYSDVHMAHMFAVHDSIPTNMVFEAEFAKLIQQAMLVDHDEIAH